MADVSSLTGFLIVIVLVCNVVIAAHKLEQKVQPMATCHVSFQLSVFPLMLFLFLLLLEKLKRCLDFSETFPLTAESCRHGFLF